MYFCGNIKYFMASDVSDEIDNLSELLEVRISSLFYVVEITN